MEVRGLTKEQIEAISSGLELDLDNLRSIGGRGFAFRLIPHNSRAPFARRSGSGRRLRATCYHGFRAAVLRFFDAGATSVRTSAGPIGRVTFHDTESFAAELDLFAGWNVGSIAEPARMIDLCACDEAA